MWSIIGLIGLGVSFSGAIVLAIKAVKSEDEILNEARLRAPVGEGPDTEQLRDSLLSMPNVQALLRQSKVAKRGLWILTVGFLLQLVSAAQLVCP
jgi:hypothetical protein